VPINSTLIARASWELFALETIVFAAGVIWATYDRSSWGPEGPVGVRIFYLAPPSFLGMPLAIVLIGRSPQATLAGLIFMAWPVIPLTIGPLYGVLDNAASDHWIGALRLKANLDYTLTTAGGVHCPPVTSVFGQ
jgi:hypothetical protein